MTNVWQCLPAGAAVLAPMEEVTDVVFRGLVRELSGRTPPALMFTEFVSLPHFLRGEREALRRLRLAPGEGPVIVQVWGTNPADYLRGCELLANAGFAGIDINMGCPQPKITRKGACAALIRNPALAASLIAAAREGIARSGRQLPLSVKTRIGFSAVQTGEWAGFLLQQGLDALTVHGRIAEQMSEGSANWDEIARVARLRDALGAGGGGATAAGGLAAGGGAGGGGGSAGRIAAPGAGTAAREVSGGLAPGAGRLGAHGAAGSRAGGMPEAREVSVAHPGAGGLAAGGLAAGAGRLGAHGAGTKAREISVAHPVATSADWLATGAGTAAANSGATAHTAAAPKSATKILGNGDVVSRGQIRDYPGRYGLDGVMIGRGVFEDPYIFSTETSIADLSPGARIDLAREHLARYRAEYGATRNFEILKKFFKIYLAGFDGADELRARVMDTHSYEAALDELRHL